MGPANRCATPYVHIAPLIHLCSHCAVWRYLQAGAGSRKFLQSMKIVMLAQSCGQREMCASVAGWGQAWARTRIAKGDAVMVACSGTGEVARVIGSASFQPQAAAFTSLLHMCAKAKLWQKALEVRRSPPWLCRRKLKFPRELITMITNLCVIQDVSQFWIQAL